MLIMRLPGQHAHLCFQRLPVGAGALEVVDHLPPAQAHASLVHASHSPHAPLSP